MISRTSSLVVLSSLSLVACKKNATDAPAPAPKPAAAPATTPPPAPATTPPAAAAPALDTTLDLKSVGGHGTVRAPGGATLKMIKGGEIWVDWQSAAGLMVKLGPNPADYATQRTSARSDCEANGTFKGFLADHDAGGSGWMLGYECVDKQNVPHFHVQAFDKATGSYCFDSYDDDKPSTRTDLDTMLAICGSLKAT